MATSFRAVQKWGNSSAVRIPKEVMGQAGISDGDQVILEVARPGVIVIRAVKDEPTLEDLLDRVTAKNRHRETAWGKRLGNEVW